MIGDEIEISVLSVSGDKVRIGIAAPREIEVFRKEVHSARAADQPPADQGEPESD